MTSRTMVKAATPPLMITIQKRMLTKTGLATPQAESCFTAR